MANRDWTLADNLSDEIVAVVNRALGQMKAAAMIDPLQLLAGQLLALKALQLTIPAYAAPTTLVALFAAVDAVLTEMTATNA